jgi:predicted nuclease of predicted toxin-antitoxin system
MKLLVDMNLSPRWVDLLADAGIDAAHWSSLGRPNAPDSEIMAFSIDALRARPSPVHCANADIYDHSW